MQPSYRKIALLHHVGGGNLGDDATLDTVVQNIRRRRPEAVIAALTINPADTKLRHQLPSYPIRSKTWDFGYTRAAPELSLKSSIRTLVRKYAVLFYLPRLAYAFLVRKPKDLYSELSFLIASRRIISSFELLIISGGGQLTEWGGPWGFPYTILKWVFLAKSARVKCLFLNVGAGPLSHPLSKFFVRRALAVADYVSFRDDQSRILVSEIGYQGGGQVFPDCVYLRDQPVAKSGPFENPGPFIVGIAPMPYCDPRVYPAEKDQVIYQDYIDRYATFASLLAKSSYLLTLFGTDIGVDPLSMKDLQLSLLRNHQVAVPDYQPVRSIDELLAMMSGLDYVVTCRYHGVIFAHLLNKPVLAISHHPKVATIMEDLGLAKYCLDIQTFDPAQLAETFASLVANREEVKCRMAASLAKNRSRLVSQFDELFPP